MAGIELATLLELETWLELELWIELEIWLELDILLELIALELLESRLLLKLLLDSTGVEELLKTTGKLLELTEEETAWELELIAADDEETAPWEELDGILAPAWLLEIVARLDCTELLTELLEELATELGTEEAWPTGGTTPPPPPQAVNATLSDTADTIRKE